MNKQTDNLEEERRVLPFLLEFVKFALVFMIVIALAIVTLHVTSAAMM